jgi:hypothetical protein
MFVAAVDEALTVVGEEVEEGTMEADVEGTTTVRRSLWLCPTHFPRPSLVIQS